MNGLSLCSGIEGLGVGLQIALGSAYRTVGYVEREASAAAALVGRMEDEALDQDSVFDDLRAFPCHLYRGKVDIITAGFPCQPWSVAGNQQGVEDERWIWPLIADIIRRVEPAYVFLENVPGLITGGGLDPVLGSVAELGFDAEWSTIRASDVGAPQQRRRVFILAYSRRGDLDASQSERLGWSGVAADAGEAVRALVHPGRTERRPEGGAGQDDEDSSRAGEPGEVLADASSGRRLKRPTASERDDDEGQPDAARSRPFPPGPGDREAWAAILRDNPELAPALEPGVCGVADGLPAWVVDTRRDRLRALGNAVVPLQAAAAFMGLARRIEERGE